jgi:hypothetical protein
MEQVGPLFEGFIQTLKPESIADFMCYIIFFLALITSMTLPDDNAQSTNLLYATMLFAIFELTVGQEWASLAAPIEQALPAFFVRVGLFLCPFIAAGSVRVKGKKGRLGLPLCVVIGIFGVLYSIGAFVVPQILGLQPIA